MSETVSHHQEYQIGKLGRSMKKDVTYGIVKATARPSLIFGYTAVKDAWYGFKI